MRQQNNLSSRALWGNDDMQQIWIAWQNSCAGFRKKQLKKWIKLCDKSDQITPTEQQIKNFFENNFALVTHQITMTAQLKEPLQVTMNRYWQAA